MPQPIRMVQIINTTPIQEQISKNIARDVIFES